MKYVLLFTSPSEPLAPLAKGESDRIMGEIMQWWEEHHTAGRITGGERLAPASTATTFRREAGSVVTVDGPLPRPRKRSAASV